MSTWEFWAGNRRVKKGLQLADLDGQPNLILYNTTSAGSSSLVIYVSDQIWTYSGAWLENSLQSTVNLNFILITIIRSKDPGVLTTDLFWVTYPDIPPFFSSNRVLGESLSGLFKKRNTPTESSSGSRPTTKDGESGTKERFGSRYVSGLDRICSLAVRYVGLCRIVLSWPFQRVMSSNSAFNQRVFDADNRISRRLKPSISLYVKSLRYSRTWCRLNEARSPMWTLRSLELTETSKRFPSQRELSN